MASAADRHLSGPARDAIAVAALAAIGVIQALILLLGHRTYFANPDNTTQFFAWYQKASSVLHGGGFPLWDQNTLSGHSFVGETQTGVFYPLNLVWLLVLGSGSGIGPRTLDMLVVFHLVLGSIGFYALARSFRVDAWAALAAAVVFAYTGAVYGRTSAQTAIFFGLCWVPWALYFAHRQLQSGRLRWGVGAGAAIGMGVLAGHFQPPFHAAVLVGLFYVLTLPTAGETWRAQLRPRLLGAAVTVVVAAVVALPQLLYSLPYFSRAYRFIGVGPPIAPGGSVSFSTFTHLYAGAPDTLLSLLDPQQYPVPDGNDLFVGLAGLAVLLFGVVRLRPQIAVALGRYRFAVIGSLAVGALAMLGGWTWFAGILYVLPFVTEVRELARYSIMVSVCLCLLLAFALQALGRMPGGAATRRRPPALAVGGALVIADGVFLIIRHAPGSTGWFAVQVVLGGLALVMLGAWPRLPRALSAAAIGLLVVGGSLHSATRPLGSTSSPFYPTRYYARTPAITAAERLCAGHRTYVAGSALPVNVADVFRGLRTQNGYGATMHVPYYDFTAAFAPTTPQEEALLDLRCFVTSGKTALAGYHLASAQPGGPLIYVNPHTSAINTPSLRPIPARTLAFDDRRMSYAFTVARQTTVVLSAIIYPGWKLTLDGRGVQAGAYTVHGVPIFPETVVGPGSHTLQYAWTGSP